MRLEKIEKYTYVEDKHRPYLEELSEFMDAYHVDVKDIDNGEFSMNKQTMVSI